MITSTAMPPAVAAVVATMMGLIVGSYLNVVVHRIPLGESTVAPRSRCPRCKRLIVWYDNIPVLSYLALRGRCRHCALNISWRYPAVELATGVLFLVCWWVFPWPALVVAQIFCALLLALSLIDAEHFLLPDKLTLPGIAVGLAGSFFASWTTPLQSLLGALVGGGGLLALIGLWYLIRRQLAMGLGDPKMLAMIGAFLGLRQVPFVLLVACTLGTLISLGLMATRRANLQTKLPFGVYLAVAALVALFFGPQIVDWYLSRLAF